MSINDALRAAKAAMPLPKLMAFYGDGAAARKSARSPFREERRASFGIFQKENGDWHWKDLGTGEHGDESDYVEKKEGIAPGKGIAKFLEIAGIDLKDYENGRPEPKPISKTIEGTEKSQPAAKPLRRRKEVEDPDIVQTFDWDQCVDAFNDDEIQKIADWRNISFEILQALKSEKLIGLHDKHIAFPVFEPPNGIVSGCHYRLGGAWAFHPKGQSLKALTFGDNDGENAWIFESQWDAIAIADALGYQERLVENIQFVVTRGASNGKLCHDALGPNVQRMVIWPQNDAPKKDGTIPSEKWLEDVRQASGAIPMHVVRTPEDFEDPDEWIKEDQPEAKTIWERISKARRLRKSPLSVRSVAELCCMEFDDADNYFGDRVIAESQPVTVLGPGGVGKSRLVMQLAILAILGRPFMDIETHAPGLRWLFIQTENSNRRLAKDLKAFMVSLNLTDEEMLKVDDCLYVHTIESDIDSFLHMESPEDYQHVQNLITDFNPDFVVFDPLNTFTALDLNSDRDMKEVISKITQATKKGNPRRVPVVIHHSLTGKQGAAKAVGWDSSSYGRNSKVLHSWARSQINIAPRDAEDETRLLMSCGKNNNGKKFPEVGLRFNEVLGIYEVDKEFDPDSFREEVGLSKKGGANKVLISGSQVADILGYEMSKPELAKLIQDEFGVGRTRAYKAIDDSIKAKTIEVSKTGDRGRTFYTRATIKNRYEK